MTINLSIGKYNFRAPDKKERNKLRKECNSVGIDPLEYYASSLSVDNIKLDCLSLKDRKIVEETIYQLLS